jgi:hypothetical protein
MSESKVILRAEARRLCAPLSLVAASLLEQFTADPILLCRYPEGDVDSISWPMPANDDANNWQSMLRSALYDARETGIIPNVAAVVLPDGSEFGIDF